MDQPEVANRIAIEQFKRLELENEKLAQELTKERHRPIWLQLPVQFVPLVTALVSVAGLLWGVLQY